MHKILMGHGGIAMTREGGVLNFMHFCASLARVPRYQEAALAPYHGQMVKGLLEDAVRAEFAAVFQERALDIVRAFYDQHFAGASFSWWGEKLLDPRVAADLQELMPESHYLLLVRDPRDVLVSRRAYAAKRMQGAEGASDRLRRIAALPAETMAQTWRAIYQDVGPRLRHCLTMRYEDYMADPRSSIEAILAHLDLEWNDGVEKALDAQGLFAAHGTAVSAGATVERWREELDEADIAQIETICREPMQLHGYEPA